MYKGNSYFFLVSISCFLLVNFSCTAPTTTVDTIYYNGKVYTVDSAFNTVQAFAVKDGKIFKTGSNEKILPLHATTRVDLHGAFVYPGFQDAHCHFYGYGIDLKKIWLTGTLSFNAVIDTLVKHKDQQISGWIFGRGWDQNDWQEKKYPNKRVLDSLFADTPVFLLRIDGHAALVNQAALDAASIKGTENIPGGVIEKINGKLTGILIDNAVDLVYKIIPHYNTQEETEALLNAQRNCFEAGLTSVTDAGYESEGLKLRVIHLIDSLQKHGEIQMRMNVMAATEELSYYREHGKIKTGKLSVNSFKIYADGSLGSRGACLLKPYADQPGHSGFLIHEPAYFDSLAKSISAINFQMCTHCIGDSAHRLLLHVYEKYLSGKPEQRWRIEHAQVIDPSDFSLYKKVKIIPSVQPVHATSDMYWAEERLGPVRVKSAYAYRELMHHAGMVAAGSDFPVESINPLFGFYAAVSRKDQKGTPAGGFQSENCLSRKEALMAMTVWAAFAAFNERETGSLEKGKYADFVILSKDIMTCDEGEIWKQKINATYIEGKPVYQRPE